ncbi:Sds3-like-domain-containing protein [Biscogniauxia mediterranea]|nr:Sds3-like-domain-containing protein [Biscogniauxia mediterranea]
MATGDTAPPPLTIAPPPIEPLSDDDGSSPLSDVEDKDADPDDLHDLNNATSTHRDHEGSSPDDLSEANDTEAETERLYDTPRNATRRKDVVLTQNAEGRVYERTPSKLRQQKNAVGEGDDDEDGPPSDEDASMASSPPAQAREASEKLQSPTLDILAEAAKKEAENRKRKRSPVSVENPEAEQTPQKRAGPLTASNRPNAGGKPGIADEEDPSSVPNSGEHSADEGINATAGEDEVDESVREAHSDKEISPRKQTRSSSKRLKGSEEHAEGEEATEEGTDAAAPEEDGAHTGEDEHMEVDVDEEAEAAHRNEEELERKKAAFEQLSGIEKRFATFRDRLYEERLEQLNQEEAMLRSDNPTHPEYLAMMQCIDARRDERIRIAERELALKLEALERWGVARRAQIHSQFFQSVRESRERILAELGQQWYDIQHERRRHANNVPEFGIRFPQSQTQRVRNALAYNKEVSILSGVAKYEGMPAAPDMKGASLQEQEDDFDAMSRNRHQTPRYQLHKPNYADYGGLPFGESLGPAGEQFIEQTPWANPHHPSNAHLLYRQHSAQHESPAAVVNNTSGPQSIPKRHQPSPFAITSGSQPFNGNARHKNAPRQPSTSPEVTRAASLLEQTKARSMKAAENRKHDTGQPVGGV